jgi:thiol reductant ABC exporter CydC subunit
MFLDTRLWQFTRGVRLRIALTVLAGVLAASVGVARLALLGWLLGRIYNGAPVAELVMPVVAIAAIMLLRGGLEYWRVAIAHETAARVQLHLRARMFDQIMSLGPAFFGVTRTGDALISMVEGVEQLEVYFGEYLPQLFVAALTPLVVFALLAWLDLPLAALLLVFAWLTMVMPTVFHAMDASASMRRRDAYHGFAAEFLDAIQGLATLKAFGQSGARGRQLAQRAHDVFTSTLWVLATNSLTRGITDLGITVGAAVTLAVGAYRVVDGTTSIEVLLMVLLAGVETFRPQRDLRTLLHNGMVGLSAAQSIFALLEAKPIVTFTDTAAAKAPSADIGVRFEDVSFAYPGGRASAHTNLDFNIPTGERVGFVGPSGAGKSTIVKLLMRFYDPQAGAVYIGGQDLRNLDERALHAQVAVVSQDTYLFHGTVEENLRFGKPDATADELRSAARLANAESFIDALPSGYRTVIGERGIRLSGGQRQRIAIARALLRDSPILVLDEALSAVDAENEAVIQQALDRLMVGRTTLVFAHRLSSVIGCDRILVLNDGQVVESGTHSELMASGPRYQALMSSQVDGAVAPDDELEVPVAPAPAPEVEIESVSGVRSAAVPELAVQVSAEPTEVETDIIRADGLSWVGVLRELMLLAVPYKGKLTLTIILGITRVLAFIGVGLASAMVVMGVRAGEDFDSWLITLAVLAPLAAVTHWLESWVAHDMAFRMLAQMRIALYDKLDRLAPAYLARRRSGDLVAMATHDVELVEYFFAHTMAPAFVAVLVPGMVLGWLGSQSIWLCVALAPFLALVALSPLAFRSRVDDLGSRARESLAELNAHVVDSIQGLHEIVAFEQVDDRRNAFLNAARRHLAIRMPFLNHLNIQQAAMEAATGLGALAVVSVGAVLSTEGALDAAVLPLLTLLALAAFLPVSEIAHVGRQLADTLGATRRIYSVQREVELVQDGPGVTQDDSSTVSKGPAIRFKSVSFAYPGQAQNAMDDVTLDIPRGSTTALVGPSGAGKTTVAHLCLRFWDPASGLIEMDGHDLRDYPLDTLRSRVALVSQDTYLFNGTMESNIRMARPDASEAALALALAQSSLTEFVASLPDGLATEVGERGMRLSGGQRQRVAIARAFLKDAPILILDEATSHLDAVSEAAVRDALESLMSNRTTLVIAHRLSTVRNADQVVVLDAGGVAEVGSHDALVNAGGMYQRLVGHQRRAASA